MQEIVRLIEIMGLLRSEKGCPWDRKQTHETLKPYLVEETYEVIDALDRANPSALKEELGDLLFQIIFHCQLASERGAFGFEDVCSAVAEKMISRHPHVFGDKVFDTPEEVSMQWEQRKREEGKNRTSFFEGIPNPMPALLKALRVQSRASKVGFDWERPQDAVPKISEELNELKLSIGSGEQSKIDEELGDLLFSIVNVARMFKINPEDALNKSIRKFIARFNYILQGAAKKDKSISELTMQEMDLLWEEAKANNL